MHSQIGKGYGPHLQELIDFQFERGIPLVAKDIVVTRNLFKVGESAVRLFDLESRSVLTGIDDPAYLKVACLNLSTLFGHDKAGQSFMDERIGHVIAEMYKHKNVQCSLLINEYLDDNGKYIPSRSPMLLACLPNQTKAENGTPDIDADRQMIATFFSELVKSGLVTEKDLYAHDVMLGKNEAAIRHQLRKNVPTL